MRYDYIEPFVTSTIRVLGGVLQSNITKGEVSLTESGWPAGDLAIEVPLFGDSEGNVVLNMNTATAVKLSARLNGNAGTSLSPIGMDALSELINMIAGNAVSVLNDEGFDFTMSPPSILVRKNSGEQTSLLEVFRIPFLTDCGDVTIQVTLRTH